MREAVVYAAASLLSPRVARPVRRLLLRAVLKADRVGASPRESVKRLLEIDDFVRSQIDLECRAWGNGVHIKHELMTGIHSFFSERIPPGANVLDIGCGYGAVAYAIAKDSGAIVTGVDINSDSIRRARQNFQLPNLEFIEGDVTEKLPPQHIDTIVLSSVVEHIEDRPKLLRQLVDLYSPRSLLIRVPALERHYYTALRRELGVFYYTDPGHYTEYTQDSFAEEMEDSGLEIIEMEIRWGDIWAQCVPKQS